MGYKSYGCGGTSGDSGGGGTGNFYEYDLSDNAWTTRTARSYATHAGVGEGSAYEDLIIWGALDPNRMKTTKWSVSGLVWSDVANLGHPLSYGHFPAFGGYMWSANGVKWDITNEVWRGDIGYQKSTFASFEIDSNLYMCGDGSETDNTCFKYTTVSEVWSQIADKPDYAYDNMRGGAGDGTYGFVYGGGSPARETYYGQTDRYDAVSNTWVTRSGTCTPARGKNGCRIDDKIYSWGGYNIAGGYGGTNSHQEYSNATDVWVSKASYPMVNSNIIAIAPPINKSPNAPTGLSASAT